MTMLLTPRHLYLPKLGRMVGRFERKAAAADMANFELFHMHFAR